MEQIQELTFFYHYWWQISNTAHKTFYLEFEYKNRTSQYFYRHLHPDKSYSRSKLTNFYVIKYSKCSGSRNFDQPETLNKILSNKSSTLYDDNRPPSCVKWTLISSTNKPLMLQSVLIFWKTSILALFIVSPYFLFERAVAKKSIDGYFSMTKCFTVIRLFFGL